MEDLPKLGALAPGSVCPACLGRGEILAGVGPGEEDCPDCDMTDAERDLFLKGGLGALAPELPDDPKQKARRAIDSA